MANTDQGAAPQVQTAALRSQRAANIPFALVASGKRLVNGTAAANTWVLFTDQLCVPCILARGLAQTEAFYDR